MAPQGPIHGQLLPPQGKTCGSAATGQDQRPEEAGVGGADVGAMISSSFPFTLMTSNKPLLPYYDSVGPISETRMSFVKPYPLAQMSLA